MKSSIPNCTTCIHSKPFENPDDIITCTLYNSVYPNESWCGNYSVKRDES